MRINTFIINPAAGAGNTKKLLKTLTKEIYAHDRGATIELTRHPLHASSLARVALKSGTERIIVVGGDGTLNEVINGFFDKDGQPYNAKAQLALVPSGTGSDFFRSLSVKKNLSDALSFAMNQEAQYTDVGVVEAQDANGLKTKRYFLNVSSVGLSGLVAGFMKTMTRKLGGKTAYFLATMQAIRALKPPTLLITVDNFTKTLEECSLVSLANGKFFGGGMKIAPDAKLDDGLFDLVTIQHLGPMFFLQHGMRVYTGTHTSLPNVCAYQKSEVHVQSLSREPVYVEVDGELFAELPARYSLLHNKVLLVR